MLTRPQKSSLWFWSLFFRFIFCIFRLIYKLWVEGSKQENLYLNFLLISGLICYFIESIVSIYYHFWMEFEQPRKDWQDEYQLVSSVIRFDLSGAFRVYYLKWIVLLEALKKLCNLFTRFSKGACYIV